MMAADAHDSATLARVPRRRESKTVRQRKYTPHTQRNRTDLGLKRFYDHKGWEAEIREALRQAGNRISEAAKLLGISRPQMFRWMLDPCFADIERPKPGPKPKKRQ